MAQSELRTRPKPQHEQAREEPTSEHTCPECSGDLHPQGSETTCTDCGLVTDEDRLDHGPDWRTFDGDETNPRRTGGPRTAARHDRGLSTTMHGRYDASGRLIGAKKRKQMNRLRRLHSRAQFENGKERNQAYVFTEIRRITSALGLAKSVRDRACDLFRSAQKERLTHGRTLEGFAAATVYATCRVIGLPWHRDDFTPVARCERRQIDNAYAAMNNGLSLPAAPLKPSAFVPRYAAELDVPVRVRQRANALVEQAEQELVLSGKPAPVAAAALYHAAQGSDLRVTQSRAADVAGCSGVTLRKRVQEVRALVREQ